MPMLAAAAGAGSSGAGLLTGSLLLGTVAAEAMAAAAIRRFGYRLVLAAGAVLLGAPALALVVREPQAVMVSVSLVRGLGFGLCGVATGALTATLLPPERRGEGLGLLGIVSGVPARRLPVIFAAATIAAGVLDSFLPLTKGISSNLSSAALLVQALTATLSRWQAGRHGDRYGHARLLIPALASSALGMAAMTVLGSPTAIFAGMALFGAGFGVLENATFALLIEQLPEAKASALWNLAHDAGMVPARPHSAWSASASATGRRSPLPAR